MITDLVRAQKLVEYGSEIFILLESITEEAEILLTLVDANVFALNRDQLLRKIVAVAQVTGIGAIVDIKPMGSRMIVKPTDFSAP